MKYQQCLVTWCIEDCMDLNVYIYMMYEYSIGDMIDQRCLVTLCIEDTRK